MGKVYIMNQATPHEFSVTLKKSGKKVTLRTMRPSSTTDPAWDDKIAGDVDTGITSLAFMDWKIKAQAPCREAEDQAEAQSILDRYSYGAKGGGVVAPKLTEEDKEEGDFSEAQLAILKARGMQV